MVCPRCQGTMYQDRTEAWEGKEYVCLQCGNRVYDRPPAPYKPRLIEPKGKRRKA